MPSDILAELGALFGVPVLPPANDPGLSPPPAVGQPGGPSIRTAPGGGGNADRPNLIPNEGPGDAAARGAMQQPFKDAAGATAKVWDNLTQVLQGIGLDLHSGLQGLQEGLPIFGVFAMLFVVFLLGLGMFLAEGEKSVVREVLPLAK